MEVAETEAQQPYMDVLAVTDSVVGILVNILVIIGGILGFSYIKKLREKQKDSIFSYLTKLSVRINFIYQILINNRDDIVERFINISNRRLPSADKVQLTYNVIEILSQNASETLKFLMNEDDQIPAQKGWTNCLNSFISFLIDCEQLKNLTFFKWKNKDEFQEEIDKYFNSHIRCMIIMLNMISDCQIDLETKICKGKNYSSDELESTESELVELESTESESDESE